MGILPRGARAGRWRSLTKRLDARARIPHRARAMTTETAPNYWDYLRLDRLLSSQGGLEDDESQLLPAGSA